jgi:hypothetical protein
MLLPDSIFYIQSELAEFATADVKIKKDGFSSPHKRGKRQAVSTFSIPSRKRLLEVCRNCGWMIHSQLLLTYHFGMPENGKEVKKQLNSFLTLMREQYPGIAYIWILEFQERGVPHFHVFTDRIHEDKSFLQWSATTWNRILKESEMHLQFQNHTNNLRRWEIGTGNYLVKNYLAKEEQKIVPDEYLSVGRFWGNSRNMIPLWKTIAAGIDISSYAFQKTIRIVTKYKERYLKKLGIKINYRQKNRSYTLKSCTNIFIQLLEHYEYGENKTDPTRQNNRLLLPNL